MTRSETDTVASGGCEPPGCPPPPGGSYPPLALARWAVLVLLAAYVLFTHLGCHGNEDNELFVRHSAVSGQILADR